MSAPQITNWHNLPVAETIKLLNTNSESGLNSQEAAQRLQQYGKNILIEEKTTPWYEILLRQFWNILIFILFIAMAISFAVGKTTDALTIFAIIILNGILGFIQEWRAEKAIIALRNMLAPYCRIIRAGRELNIAAEHLVPGDIVLLETGDRIPADLRLLHTVNLKTDESMLTGESFSVDKDVQPVSLDKSIAERTSMGWMGTSVVNGHARGVVVNTGMNSEFGHIATLTQTVKKEISPLKQKLTSLGKKIGIFAIFIAALTGVIGLLTGKNPVEMFFTAVSLAVAIVPEGLPTVVIITMALGVRIMAKRRALLRRLSIAETLGAATIICTDKTGTLTKNEMTVETIWLPNMEVQVGSHGYIPEGDFKIADKTIEASQQANLIELLKTGLICNHARVYQNEEKHWEYYGDPTEIALVTAAYKADILPLEDTNIVSEFSFNSSRKCMTVVTTDEHQLKAYTKGAPEVVIEKCAFILEQDNIIRPINESDRHQITLAYTKLAQKGMRILALANRTLDPNINLAAENIEQQLVFLGLAGMIDPPRPEVKAALVIAKQAGIKTIMVTGDAALTAMSIAKKIGLTATQAITGNELENLSDEELSQILKQEVIFARTSPEQKLRIVELLQKQKEIVGMTGDGVNDAPALKKADIGISMGLRGTDVAKDASDMILADDNFATIIGAIAEGRRQLNNIRKFVHYLLSSNMAEIIAILFNIILGGPLILLPVQILWINLITDGVSAIALGIEPMESDVMHKGPRATNRPILSRAGMIMLSMIGAYMGIATLCLFYYYLDSGIAIAQTIAFTSLIIFEKVNVFNFRTMHQPLIKIGIFSNPWLLAAVASVIAAQLCAIYVPFLQRLLHTAPLSLHHWGAIIALALPIFIFGELYKSLRLRYQRFV